MAREKVKFLEVEVDDGVMRWKQADEVRAITEVEYETEEGLRGRFQAFACDGDALSEAHAAHVEDSSDGIVWLIVGGRDGLLLRHSSGVEVREPYLLLTRTAHVA